MANDATKEQSDTTVCIEEHDHFTQELDHFTQELDHSTQELDPFTQELDPFTQELDHLITSQISSPPA